MQPHIVMFLISIIIIIIIIIIMIIIIIIMKIIIIIILIISLCLYSTYTYVERECTFSRRYDGITTDNHIITIIVLIISSLFVHIKHISYIPLSYVYVL